MKIVKVTGEARKGGFHYVAHYEDGSTQIVRKVATRPYANAFVDERGKWTFGKKYGEARWHTLVGQYIIEFLSVPCTECHRSDPLHTVTTELRCPGCIMEQAQRIRDRVARERAELEKGVPPSTDNLKVQTLK